ncbi:hypothetical protein BATDEDRAFT_89772 [Batrachochytrium dendrobatidis JAM81]|uniref:Uncharacterized protein n=2 Tax=Batrachochytrium dendrobatidis TaxID=109871 RepID=F4P5R3_BATDJ|nr:uncharacterized protein BATDEDRAFT_89772 [Batrachochytrium dendrobatidis JAM81]EGF79465.1 hypothetical protein BATDEDRAFT_89772 [Batrachochytrium dendrobatidis JAM81]|eukprot:XP_006680162.1 hypothetical protein BATDEDRAFT_89772 [Batrachochytrium dendrobatidis JAM81]
MASQIPTDTRLPHVKTPLLSSLESLQEIRIQTALLESTETQIVETTKKLDHTTNLLSETCAEQMQLLDERVMLMDQLKIVQQDYETMNAQASRLQAEKTKLQNALNELQDGYLPFKDQVDILRGEHGLKSRPTLQQVIESQMSCYLEERRGRWIKNGLTEGQSFGKTGGLASGTGSTLHSAAVSKSDKESSASHTALSAGGSRAAKGSVSIVGSTRVNGSSNKVAKKSSFTPSGRGRGRPPGSVATTRTSSGSSIPASNSKQHRQSKSKDSSPQ